MGGAHRCHHGWGIPSGDGGEHVVYRINYADNFQIDAAHSEIGFVAIKQA